MIQHMHSISGPQLAFILALPLAEWVTSCIAIDHDDALRVAARPPTATKVVADALKQALGAATTTDTLSSSTVEAVVRGAQERRQLLASPILSIYTYKEGVSFKIHITTHIWLTVMLAMTISVWQERESLDCASWTYMVHIIGISLIGKALSWYMSGSRETVARNAAGHPVYGLAILRPKIHLLAYGASGLLTYMALFLHPGSFFLLFPMLFLAFTGASSYVRIYTIDPSLRSMLLGSCQIVSLLALGSSLLVWIARDNAPPKSENGDGNDVSGRWSEFDDYAIVISMLIVMISLHSVLVSALARLDIALARSKATCRLLFVDPATSTASYSTLPPLKKTPSGGGPTGPRLVVPGLTPSSLRLGLYTVVGLLSTTLFVVAAPGLEWMLFTNPKRSEASLAASQYAAVTFSPLVFTPLVYLAACFRDELRAVWRHREPRAILKQDEEQEVAEGSTSDLREKAAVGLLSGGKDNAE